MRVFDFVAIFISIFLSVIGQLLLKMGMLRIGKFSFDISTLVHQYIKILLNPFVIAGLVGFFVSMLIWLYVLSRMELSFAYPFVALNYVLILFGSYFLFKETITPIKIVGVVTIIIGVCLVARGG